MTVATTASTVSYSGDGSTTSFSFPYKYISSSDLKVYLYDEDNGISALQASGYTVTPTASATNGVYPGASIVFTTAPGTDKQVVIERDPALTQEFDFDSESDPLPVLTRHADLEAMRFQAIDRRLDRAITLDPGLPGTFDFTIPNIYDADSGDVLALNGTKTGLIFGAVATGTTISSALEPIVQASTRLSAGAMMFGGHISVKDPAHGAVGNDSTSDTAAFQSAVDAALATYDSSTTGQGMTWNNRQSAVFIPPGDYYLATGLTQTSGNILFYAIPNTVRIRLGSGVYFMTASGSPQNVYVHGLSFVGGKGAFKFSTTGNNVSGNRTFEHCKFDAYTECAVGNLADDEPYWNFLHCEFKGVNTGGSIGIAIGGYIDDSAIAHCDFMDNKYNIKLGPKLSGNVAITRCSFVQFTPSILTADIWFVPNATDPGATNSGWGISIDGNKFSNENLQVGDSRILVASEGTGTDRLSKVHSTSFASSGAYVSGVSITNNRITGVSSSTAAFIKSYCGLLPFWSFDDNDINGGAYTYLCEMMGSITNEDAYFYQTWIVRLTSMIGAGRPFSVSVFNEPLGFVDDPLGLMQGDPMVRPFPTTADDAGYTSLISSNGDAGLSVAGGAAHTTNADLYAVGSRGSQVTFSASGSSNYAYASLATATSDKPSYAVVWLKAHATQSVARVSVTIFNFTTSVTAMLRSGIKLTTGWVRHVIPFVFPDGASQSDWQLKIYCDDYTVTTGDKALVGAIRVYHAPTPQPDGHIKTLESGLYDGGHILLASRHTWHDADGYFRSKASAPSSATDGIVIAPSQLNSCTNGTLAAGTVYLGPLGSDATEGDNVWLMDRAGTVRKMRVRADTAPVGTETFIYTLRLNASDQTQTITVTGNAVSGTDTAHPITFAAGDYLSVKCVVSASAVAARHQVVLTID